MRRTLQYAQLDSFYLDSAILKCALIDNLLFSDQIEELLQTFEHFEDAINSRPTVAFRSMRDACPEFICVYSRRNIGCGILVRFLFRV